MKQTYFFFLGAAFFAGAFAFFAAILIKFYLLLSI